MRKKLPTYLLILVFLTGLSLLLYPPLSDYWNSFHQSRAISEYTDLVAHIDEQEYEAIRSDAEAYNQALPTDLRRFHPSDAEHEAYMKLLNINGHGIMGHLRIPVIDCSLPIYHSVDEAVLQIAVGHIEGTSLPVGGPGTHCVLSGHRGLPSARLLSNLDKVSEGDIFMIQTLETCLTYQVDQIRIVQPNELSDLDIVPGRDYCTLVTCTPYGINSHRLLVRGHRIENREEADKLRVPVDARQIDPTLVAAIVAVPLLMIVMTVMLLGSGKKKR